MTLPAAPKANHPRIDVNAQFHRIDDKARDALVAANTPPTLFRRDGRLVRIDDSDRGVQVQEFTPAMLTRRLSDVASWVRESEPSEDDDREPKSKDVFPEIRVVQSILDDPPAPLPLLDRVATVPFFEPDGRLVAEPGYHEHARAFLANGSLLAISSIPEKPTSDDVHAAEKLLLGDALLNFPFAEDGDRAHALALALEPFVASLIGGNMPLHVFEAPESGSGKSLLGDVCSLIATGRRMAWRPFPTREEEREKSIFSALRSGHTFVAFDNLKGQIESPALESALTSEFIQSRVLGGHTEGTVRNAASWVIAVNNAQLSRDLVRRSVRSRIDAKMENPEERTVFLHQDLRAWVLEHRAELVRALLLLVQNWIALERPDFQGRPLASFERWSRVIGGIIESAGIPGFLSPSVTMAGSDPKKPEAGAFVVAWFERFRTEPVTAKDLLDAVCAPPDQSYADLRPPREVTHLASVLSTGPVGGRSVRLGKWLRENADRVIAGFRVERAASDSHTKVNRFAVKQLGAAPPLEQGERPSTAPAPDVTDNPEFGE